MLAHIDPNFVLLEDQVSLGLDELPEYGVFPSIGLPSDPGGFNCGTTFLRYFRVNILEHVADCPEKCARGRPKHPETWGVKNAIEMLVSEPGIVKNETCTEH